MREAGARVLAIDAGRTLLIDRAGVPGAGRGGRRGRRRPRPPRRGEARMPERACGPASSGVGALGRHHARVWAGVAGRARSWASTTRDAARAAEVAAAARLPRLRRPRVAARGRRRRLGRRAHGRRTTPWPARRSRPGRDVLRREADDRDARGGRRPDRAAPRRAGAILQVGHIERFNPATAALLSAGPGRPLRRGAPAGLVLAAQPRRGRGAGPDGPRPRHRARASTARSPSRSRRWGCPC